MEENETETPLSYGIARVACTKIKYNNQRRVRQRCNSRNALLLRSICAFCLARPKTKLSNDENNIRK